MGEWESPRCQAGGAPVGPWYSLVKVAVGRPQAFHMLLPIRAWFPNYRVDA